MSATVLDAPPPVTKPPRRTGGVRFIGEPSVQIPPGINSYESFAAWAVSDDFPEDGPARFAWIDDNLEVEMTGGDIILHESPKSQIGAVIVARSNRLGFGRALIDGAIYLLPDAQAGNAPDVSVVRTESIQSGRVVARGSVSGRVRLYEGPPDLAVEVVSPADPQKDAVRLFNAYYRGGVTEYWLVDATGADVSLTIFTRGEAKFEPAAVDTDGFQSSPTLRAKYRLVRIEAADGEPDYRLEERE